MARVEFRLSMPSRSSWNGGWSGADRNYVLVRPMPVEEAAVIVANGPYFHRWDDGWGALIDVRLMEPGERKPKSDGFSGYDWMVANIIEHGSAYTKEPVPA